MPLVPGPLVAPSPPHPLSPSLAFRAPRRARRPPPTGGTPVPLLPPAVGICGDGGAACTRLECVQVGPIHVVVAAWKARLWAVEAFAARRRGLTGRSQARLDHSKVVGVHVLVAVRIRERPVAVGRDVGDEVIGVVEVDPADVLAPGVAAETAGGRVEASLLAGRLQGRARVEVDPADILARGEAKQVAR